MSVKLEIKYQALALFKIGKLHEAAARFPLDLVSASRGSRDHGILTYYCAVVLYRLGRIPDSMFHFREAIDNEKIDSKYRSSACYNLGMQALLVKDIEHSRSCYRWYQKSPDAETDCEQHWRYFLECHDSRSYDIRSWVKLTKTKQNATRVQFLIVKLAQMLNDQELLIQYRNAVDLAAVRSANMMHALAFLTDKADDVHDLHLMSIQLDGGRSERILSNHIYLRFLEMSGADLEARFQVASSIVSMIESISEPDLDDIVAHCSQVLRERLEVDDVLVSDRHGLVGISPAITRLRDRIDRYARSSAPVLLRGATGTGKELVARALHVTSERHRSPFLALNCAAVPEGVFESQLFGHVAGTFTGATRDQPGLIELAGEGTLFLDEVGELPLGVQAKLLRFLESGEHRRLGSDRSLRSRARILAATHRVLEGSAGFRQDLLHRLQRLEIELPELVERPEDVRYLARFRVGILNGENGRHWKRLGKAAEDRLLELRLAGNVRELFNLLDHAWQEAVHEIGPEQIERARQRAEEARRRAAPPSQVEVRFGDAASWTLDFAAGRVPLKRLQEQAACSLVRQALEHFGGDAEKVAAFLDISRRSVYRYLERDRRAGEDRPAAG